MGDSCWFQIEVKNCDVEKFKQTFEPLIKYPADEENEHDGTTNFIFYEAEYGFYNELEILSTTNLQFSGNHDSGGGYGSHTFVSNGTKRMEIEQGHDGGYVCNFDTAMNILQSDIDTIKEFLAMKNSVHRYFAEKINEYPTLKTA